jgi:hypothetical protein
MFDANTVNQSATEPENNGLWTQEQAEAHMREFLASLPPPLSFEELAHVQGVTPITNIRDLPRWPEDDLEAWDGFDEFLEELRHGQQEWAQQERDTDLDRS